MHAAQRNPKQKSPSNLSTNPPHPTHPTAAARNLKMAPRPASPHLAACSRRRPPRPRRVSWEYRDGRGEGAGRRCQGNGLTLPLRSCLRLRRRPWYRPHAMEAAAGGNAPAALRDGRQRCGGLAVCAQRYLRHCDTATLLPGSVL